MKFDADTRIFVAGCGGMLGDAVYAHFSPKCAILATDIDLSEPWIEFGDVRDFDGISRKAAAFEPDLIVNLAAVTDLEECERDPKNAWLTNALGAENLGIVANHLKIPYVYISTAGIFDGAKDCYTDFDSPHPISVYGASKLYGEEWTLATVEKHFVLRAGWMMGGGPKKDKKFVNKIYRQIRSGAKTLYAVNDKIGTPTYTHDFVRGMALVVGRERCGLYNQVCGGVATRYDVARAFVDDLGLSGKVRVEAVSSDRFEAEYFAPRPASEHLSNLKLDALGMNVMRNWRECLTEYAKAFST